MTDVLPPESTALILAPAAPGEVAWHVIPGDDAALAVWVQARDRWLKAKQRRSGRDNTVNAYTTDWTDFFVSFRGWVGQDVNGHPTAGLMPWQVGKMHAQTWVDMLQERDLAAATIIRKVSALSSFYDYCMHDYTIQVPGRGEQALWDHPNPFRIRDLPKPNSQPVYPTTAEVGRVLEQIDISTATGLRNMALIAGIFATTRRVSEWTQLRWGDIHEGADGHWFTYRYKGGAIKKQAMPADIHTLVLHYLRAANRTPARDEYLFVAHHDSARQFGALGPDYDPAGQAISESYVWSLLHRYGAAAGIDDLRKMHPHGLRHAGARYRKELGADIWELQAILGHGNISVTERYSKTVLEEPEDKYAGSIRNMLPRQLRLELDLAG